MSAQFSRGWHLAAISVPSLPLGLKYRSRQVFKPLGATYRWIRPSSNSLYARSRGLAVQHFRSLSGKARRGIGVRSPFRKDAVPQKYPRLLGILLVRDGGSWKRKTGQKAGLEGFQSIQRNAVELDVVPETGIEPATFALRVRCSTD